MIGKLQRIFRRRASGSPRRGVAGLVSRLPARLRGRKGRERMPWGKQGRARMPWNKKDRGPMPRGTQGRGRMPWGKRAEVAKPAAQPTDGAFASSEVGATATSEVVTTTGSASFRDRGKLRRRLRFLRRARELAFRDVGGLIFDMRRFGRDRPDLVEAKLGALAAVDTELRALERVLDDRRAIHELREPGLSSCPRCGALHASEDNFCPRCGLQFGGAQAIGEVGGAIAAPPQPPPAPIAQQPTAPTLLVPGFAATPPAPSPQAPAPQTPSPAPTPSPASNPPPAAEQPTEIQRPRGAP